MRAPWSEAEGQEPYEQALARFQRAGNGRRVPPEAMPHYIAEALSVSVFALVERDWAEIAEALGYYEGRALAEWRREEVTKPIGNRTQLSHTNLRRRSGRA